MTVLVAPVAGPLLGGYITDNISWPWIFYINIPVGLLAAAITWSIYRARDAVPVKSKLDYVGLALLVIWVGAMQIMVDKGQGARLVQLGTDHRVGGRRRGRLRIPSSPGSSPSRTRSSTCACSASATS